MPFQPWLCRRFRVHCHSAGAQQPENGHRVPPLHVEAKLQNQTSTKPSRELGHTYSNARGIRLTEENISPNICPARRATLVTGTGEAPAGSLGRVLCPIRKPGPCPDHSQPHSSGLFQALCKWSSASIAIQHCQHQPKPRPGLKPEVWILVLCWVFAAGCIFFQVVRAVITAIVEPRPPALPALTAVSVRVRTAGVGDKNLLRHLHVGIVTPRN